MKDTVYSIDTVYLQKKIDSVSQSDMLQQVGTMHSMYEDNFSNLVIIVSIIAGIIGVFLPILLLIIQNRSNQKELDRLKKDLNEEILDEYDKRLSKEVKKLRGEIKIELERTENLNKFYANYIQALTMISLNQPYTVYNNFLGSSIYAIKLNDLTKLDYVIGNLIKMKKDNFVVEKHLIKIDDRLTLSEYKKLINDLTNGDDNLKVFINKLFQLANDILDNK